jgi:hypothetical protein
MSRSRASAVFATLVTMLALLAGTATFTSAAASASPTLRPYPPPPPSLVVNHGWIWQNSSVRVTGRKYAARERVYVSISPAQPHRRPVDRRFVVYANRSGGFTFSARLTGIGRVVIRATGQRSDKSASVVVFVRKRHGHGPGFQPAAFTTGLTPAASTTSPGDQGLVLAGLGALALLSGAAITSHVTRRRRKVYAG